MLKSLFLLQFVHVNIVWLADFSRGFRLIEKLEKVTFLKKKSIVVFLKGVRLALFEFFDKLV